MRIFFLCALALAGCGNSTDPAPNMVEPSASSPVAIPVAPAPAAYHAVGTEPGWALTIAGATMNYEGDYGTVKISEPTPAGFKPEPGDYAGQRIKLTISAGPCSDGMSDRSYRQTVRLVADGKTVEGCGGGTAATDGLADSKWNVTAINGRATPSGASYVLAFTDDKLSATFGCNGISGKYQVNGDHVSTSGLIQTEMGCAEPAMTFERQGSGVLGSNMRVERIGDDQLRLVSEAGSIDLRRAE